MTIDLQQIVNSHHTVRFVSVLARVVPPSIGYPVCDLIGKWAATRRQSRLARAVRLNQWMARGASLEREMLDKAVRETLQNNARDIFDLYHFLERPEATWKRICFNRLAEELIRRPEFSDRGLVIAGIHLSGFDSVMLSLVRQGAKGLVLTIPNPQGGRRLEFEMRRRTGMNILPASLDTLRQAIRHLEKGGLVLTGIDRPVTGPRLRPRFFGQPAPLPTHHILLAIKSRVPVILMAVIRQKDGKYKLLSSEPIEMEIFNDHERGILRNAERVLQQAEGFIHLAPQQWNVPLPIWPELMDGVPA
jgi:phosphatidylinositol dimannoside acyltransferase